MLKNKRGLSLILVVLLLLSSATVLADNDKSKKDKPNKFKVEKAIEEVDVLNSLKWLEGPYIGATDGHRVEIKGKLRIDERFKGNTKVKLEFNNVVVNPKPDGSFSRFMSVDKDPILTIKVFVGKTEVGLSREIDLLNGNVKENDSKIKEAIRALELAIQKIYRKDLTLDDKPLVVAARVAMDNLKKLIGNPLPNEFAKIEAVVVSAEKIISELEKTTLRWITEPYVKSFYDKGREIEGKLFIPDNLKGKIEVEVNGEEVKLDKGTLKTFVKGLRKDIVVEVFVDGKEQEDLERILKIITDRDAAKAVIDKIAALPIKIKLTDRSDVLDARIAYNKLSDVQKDLVKNLDILINAEEQIRLLEEKTIAWITEPENTGDREFYGRLNIEYIAKDRVNVLINRKELNVDENGSFLAYVSGNNLVSFKVYLDGINIKDLTRTAR